VLANTNKKVIYRMLVVVCKKIVFMHTPNPETIFGLFI